MTSLRFLSPTLLLLLAATSGTSMTSYRHRRVAEPWSRVVDVDDPCKAGEWFDCVLRTLDSRGVEV